MSLLCFLRERYGSDVPSLNGEIDEFPGLFRVRAYGGSGKVKESTSLERVLMLLRII